MRNVWLENLKLRDHMNDTNVDFKTKENESRWSRLDFVNFAHSTNKWQALVKTLLNYVFFLD